MDTLNASPSSLLYLLGYGSLIFDPERPELVIERRPVILRGYQRSFNKLSRSRACSVDTSYNQFPPPRPQFRRNEQNVSLVLGTEPSDQGVIRGLAIGYPEHAREEVLQLTDRREGFSQSGPSYLNGYCRERVTVEGLSGGILSVETYFSNHDPDAAYRVSPALTLAEKARVLINATPRVAHTRPNESRGLYYLERTREGLRDLGIVDAVLEALVAAVLSDSGPWCDLLHPPH